MEKIHVLHEKKIRAIAELIKDKFGFYFKDILIIGCGSGLEVIIFRETFKCKTVGIEIDRSVFDPKFTYLGSLLVADAQALPFSNYSFDLVFSFHVLEHIPDYRKALAEMYRVLRNNGVAFVGVPNKSRILGYIGSENASLKDKICWNLIDWKARITGKFKNECGAHAGFSAEEIKRLLSKDFKHVIDTSLDYYQILYPKYSRLLSGLKKTGLAKYIFPALFYAGIK
jgi:ubiquinone/menaquinone biosynthesis C-methylase UbiE